MQKLFNDTRILDAECKSRFNLSEEIMMENAATSMELFVRRELKPLNKKCSILILCGPGNNGADGYVLARKLCGDFNVTAVCLSEPKTELCITQKERAVKAGVSVTDGKSLLADKAYFETDLIADCIFGAGFHGKLDGIYLETVNAANKSTAFKLACDIPSGLQFTANATITMGALKTVLFCDRAKDVTGKILTANLGVSQSVFESNGTPEAMLLEESDMILPLRKKQNVHKGSFGHVVCVSGEKPGASVIAGCSALRFGAGLVTLVSDNLQSGQKLNVNEDGFAEEVKSVPFELMCSKEFPQNTKAVAVGMGLGHCSKNADTLIEYLSLHTEIPCVIDADLFYYEKTIELLKKRSAAHALTVITPHPKEMCELLKLCGAGTLTVEECVEKRVELTKKLCSLFPETVVVAKGACTVIGFMESEQEGVKLYVNPCGTSALAKAGSGDVLDGMTAALLSQGYDSLTAAITASLGHALAGRGKNYSLTPFKLIDAIGNL